MKGNSEKTALGIQTNSWKNVPKNQDYQCFESISQFFHFSDLSVEPRQGADSYDSLYKSTANSKPFQQESPATLPTWHCVRCKKDGRKIASDRVKETLYECM